MSFRLFCAALLSLAVLAPANNTSLAQSGDHTNGQTGSHMPLSVQVDVVYLSADILGGRATGSSGEFVAAHYIASRFKELGLTPAGEDGWFQSFSFGVSSNPHATNSDVEMVEGNNVLGYLDNGAPSTVVIGAHYDHLGMGGAGSRSPGENAIHNGADDNASGVAGILEIARQLLASSARSNNYLFVAFSGEELGLYGSKHLVASELINDYAVNYMINLDMVGRLGDDMAIAINGTGTSEAWDGALEDVGSALVINKHESGLGPSDHASFYLNDTPVVHFFTGQHEDYHKPEDDSHLINYDGIFTVSSFAVDLIETLNDDGRLTFQKTVDESQTRSAFKVSLGIMPDYVSSGGGVRIDGVMDNRPGAAAGLQKGDVIVKLGDVEIVDIGAYMEALSNFDVGDRVAVIVKRGDEMVESTVQF
jgi:hypothetical protein